MSLYVSDFLKLPEMKPAVVHSAHDLLDKRCIEGISVIETPVEDFVQKNEIVLSTAIGCSDEANFLDFINEIYHSDAAALVIATGRYVINIPEIVISYAKSVGFPLIEIPWHIRFAEITKAILKNILGYTNSYAKELASAPVIKTENKLSKIESPDYINQLLTQTLLHEDVHNIVTEVIGQLIEYDRMRKLDLISTCLVYLQHNGNASQTAPALHLHRQSLLYRLKKIEILTHLSLESSDDLFLLDLCIRIWRLKKV